MALAAVDTLRARRVYLADPARALALVNETDLDTQQRAALGDLLQSRFLRDCPVPALFDVRAAIRRYGPGCDTDSAWSGARVNFLGTDGIRGKTSTADHPDFLPAFARDSLFSADLAAAIVRAFLQALLDTGAIAAGDTVVFGADGRDVTTGWKYTGAIADTVAALDLRLLDLSVVTTAMVPYYCLRNTARAGIALTASHNPADQNGVKLFLDGRKLLPEGGVCDTVVSAYLYDLWVNRPALAAHVVQRIPPDDPVAAGADLVVASLPPSRDALRGLQIVFDGANGSSTALAQKVFEKLAVAAVCVNGAPDGRSINRDCGIAEIEHCRRIDRADSGNATALVRTMFELGQAPGTDRVFGIALDGDGDRGFVLYYDRGDDAVYVLNGDTCAFLVAKYLSQQTTSAGRRLFACTIESDPALPAAVAEQFGFGTRILSVGDKWFARYDRDLALGSEVSGHMVLPLEIPDANGKTQTLLSGIGILSALYTLAAIEALGVTAAELKRPFAGSHTSTRYTFFVDKSRFHRDSAVWREDKRIILDSARELMAQGRLDTGLAARLVDKEDANLLYVAFERGTVMEACVFVRNSGTENKNAVYVQCRPCHRDAMEELAQRLQDHHARELKDRACPEYPVEEAALALLDSAGALSLPDLRRRLNEHPGERVDAVLRALQKEKRIVVSGDMSVRTA